ncbi:hypothetical protein AC578_5845 [Pseudocercospora eumusae]|uniref:Uncharacterized protein n=1 Tax=Pseudocercospora eumusae TaxID=321146 RepID=A0A139H221_9PEZI|nr:hypothetical protein AC578_5845 [Pseudocercospora eumusae]
MNAFLKLAGMRFASGCDAVDSEYEQPGRFIFYASDFKNGKPSLDLIRFRKYMGDKVRTLIYSGADFLSLRSALNKLLEMFPTVEEVVLLNATRKQLYLAEKIFDDRRYIPYCQYCSEELS